MMNRTSRVAALTVAALLMLSSTSFAGLPNPSPEETARARAQGFCSDPWVTLAIANVTGGGFPAGAENYGQCMTTLYNGGAWNSFDQLVRAVDATLRQIPRGTFTMADNHNGTVTIITNAGGGYQSWIKMTGRIVSQGGGNIILNGGGNIVSQGGGNIILNGGGNYRLNSVEQKAISLPDNRILIVNKADRPPQH